MSLGRASFGRGNEARAAQSGCMVLLKPCRFRSGSTFFCVLAGIALALPSTPSAAVADEEWVATFVRFVDWPQSPSDNVIIVCQPHNAPTLALHGVQVRGLTLQVVHLRRPQDAARCHVFSAMSLREGEWLPWLATFRARPTLALGSGSRFCETGGAICVVKDDATGAEKYRVNIDAISRAGLKVRLPLLRHQRSAKTSAE